jgi:heme exporter protein CcmD
MGNYGVFVWSSYGVVLGGLLWLMISSLLEANRVRKCHPFKKSV